MYFLLNRSIIVEIIFNEYYTRRSCSIHGEFRNTTQKYTPVPAKKAYGGSRGTAPLILNLSARWKWVVNFTPPAAVPPGKEPLYTISCRPDRRRGRPAAGIWIRNRRSCLASFCSVGKHLECANCRTFPSKTSVRTPFFNDVFRRTKPANASN